MSAPFTIQLNGKARTFTDLVSPTDLAGLILRLDLKADRIAVEHNGEIVRRAVWADIQVADGDRLEIVHFVGGGTGAA
jgi:sulfur carrier protein